ESQQIIKTVHGRGYIFDTDVTYNTASQVGTLTEEAASLQIVIEELETNGDRPNQSVVKTQKTASLENFDSLRSVEAARRITRLMVLPFRMLRADPDVDFLAFSVPDAVAGALSVLDSVIVCSPAGSARYAQEILDLTKIAAEAQADAVLTG